MSKPLLGIAFALMIVGAIGLCFTVGGCAAVPPGNEAEALKSEIVDLAKSFEAVADAQLADANPDNDAKARHVKAAAQSIRLALTDPAGALAELSDKIKDPYAAGLVVYAIAKIERWQQAEHAAQVAAP